MVTRPSLQTGCPSPARVKRFAVARRSVWTAINIPRALRRLTSAKLVSFAARIQNMREHTQASRKLHVEHFRFGAADFRIWPTQGLEDLKVSRATVRRSTRPRLTA